MQLELYVSYLLVMPKKKNYHRLFNYLSITFDQLLAIVAGNPGIVPLVVWSSSENQANVEVERPRETYAMTLRNHMQGSAVYYSRL